MNVYIFGLGKGKKYLDRCLLKTVSICGYIDNYRAGTMIAFAGKPVIRQNALCDSYNYIIITLLEYDDVRRSLIDDGIEQKKIISFFDFTDASNEEYWKVIDPYKWRTELMWKYYLEILKPTMDNLNYELYANSEIVRKKCPQIMDVERTIQILYNEKKCLARFGDNEFELMFGRLRTNYQDTNTKLADRLKEVLNSHEDNLLIAIADNYGSLAKYTDEAARDIRMYMTKEVRENHIQLLDLNRQYYDAYLSRTYLMYRDKTNVKNKFDNIKKIWDNKNVLIVEGRYTRFGVGNDLLENAKDVKRIIVPDKNAFEKYDEIIKAVRFYGKNKLILSIIGPTATVLSYDLAREGYWIIDIGQLDTEYEWFIRGVDKRCSLKYKNVSEAINYEAIEDITQKKEFESYFSGILETIS